MDFNKDKKLNLTETKRETLHNIMQITELGIDLQQRCVSGEKHIAYLKSVFEKASIAISKLETIARYSLEHAHKVISNTLDNNKLTNDHETTVEFENILMLVEKHLSDLDNKENEDRMLNIEKKKEKRSIDNLSTNSLKSLKSDMDEKYPENWSKESLIDLNNVVNLPPVPEDIFTSFSGKPTRSSSLSSLKSMRKVKLFLQKAESSEDDENSSENEEHYYSKLVYGDSEENRVLPNIHNPPKKHLGNIKEETPTQD